MGRRLPVAAVAATLLLAAPADAGPFLDWSRPARAHVGDLIRAQAGAGVRMYALLPVYLVAVGDAPPIHPCALRNGRPAICPTTSLGPPRGERYHRIGTLNVRHANTVRISYRVPALEPGRYVYVLYCGPCWRGPRGSLIAFDDRRAATLTVVRRSRRTPRR